MKALIKITGTQTADGEQDVIELTTNGILQRKENGWLLTYNETEATPPAAPLTWALIRPSASTFSATQAARSNSATH